MTVSSVTDTSSAATSLASTTTTAADTSDRFLKLLVAQMKNQDPLSPMDNAQVTSQMAQINTVSGIQQLNTSVQGLSSQFVQMQALQGASLVGREVTVKGSQLTMLTDGAGHAGYELAGPADQVKVDVISGSGQVLGSLNLGAQSTGVHAFDWTPPTGTDTTNLRFRVTATSGASAVTTTPLMLDTVESVNAGGTTLTLDLQNSGTVDYSAVKALN